MAADHPSDWDILQAVVALATGTAGIGKLEYLPKETKSAAQFARLVTVNDLVDGLIIEFLGGDKPTKRFQDGRISTTGFMLTRIREVDATGASLQTMLESVKALEDKFALVENRTLGLSAAGVDVSHDLLQRPGGPADRTQADMLDVYYCELVLMVTARSC